MERPAVADYPPGARLATRVIDDFELVWMLRGQARLTLDEAELSLSPGQLLLVPPGVRHGFVWDEDRPSRHGYVHFGPQRIRPPQPTQVQIRRMTPDDPLAGLCAYLLWLAGDAPDGWQPRASETLQLILSLIVAGPLPPGVAAPVLVPALAAAIGELRQEWSRMPLHRMGVGELARRAHVSPGYLNRLLRAGFGVSAAAALERVRCSRAESLLLRTDLTVEAVAHHCGFADPSHFSHRFTAIHGVSPRAYRAAGTPSPSVLNDPGVRRLSHLLWG
ncbi:MAG TPA: AraC family transcriptional regulator [Acidimicrobiales bacterium]|nr:AraC family transcriptional regulator [Acidimicrobiales bacterium]